MLVDRYFTVHRRDLVYLAFLVESYEGLAVVTTVAREGDNALVRVWSPLGHAEDIGKLLTALQEEIGLTEVAAPREREECHAGNH